MVTSDSDCIMGQSSQEASSSGRRQTSFACYLLTCCSSQFSQRTKLLHHFFPLCMIGTNLLEYCTVYAIHKSAQLLVIDYGYVSVTVCY